jgi:hypothetical protein
VQKDRASPSILLHPPDLIGGDKLTALNFFPVWFVSEKKARVSAK